MHITAKLNIIYLTTYQDVTVFRWGEGRTGGGAEGEMRLWWE